MIKEEKFREDLYFRLNVLKVHIPSLRERNGDILLLSAYYLNKISNDEGGPEKYLDEDASNYLKTLEFPGNIRELKNFIHRLYLSSRNSVITVQDIKNIDSRNSDNKGLDGLLDNSVSLADFRNQAEINFLKRQLELCGNNVGDTAKRLGMTSSNLHRRLKALRITVKE
jgi:two-component system nitrogen regulation response regulator NtrX